jgi:hypothetical protein
MCDVNWRGLAWSGVEEESESERYEVGDKSVSGDRHDKEEAARQA